METKRPANQVFSLNGILLLSLIAMGTYLSRTALHTSRPSIPTPSALRSDDDIPCRLWQDPFKAIEEDRRTREERNEPSQATDSPYNCFSQALSNISGNLKILLVFMHHGNSAENYENRLKTRYSVLAALSSCGYFPNKTETIDCIQNAETTDFKGVMMVIPYERFKKNRLLDLTETASVAPVPQARGGPAELGTDSVEKENEEVLVLWLRDDYYLENPLDTLSRLVNDIISVNEQTKLCVIGPTTSTLLGKMFKRSSPAKLTLPPNGSCANDSGSAGPLKTEVESIVNLYSPWSTAIPQLLGRTDTDHLISNGIDFQFIRTIGKDDRLAWNLLQELDRRGIDCREANAHIVLISECDTFYGKAFAKTFSALIEKYEPGQSLPPLTDSDLDNPIPTNLQLYSYMRGIDGKIPTSKSLNAMPSSKQSDGQSEQLFTFTPEPPVGRSRTDYIRRLAYHLSRDCRQTNVRPHAFGIIGSDVYDKLLLMQALREEFKDPLFFTTDLDVRLMHHQNFRWTRNLVVASNYGLTLDHTLQPHHPPFRDNYQTALFLTCQAALGDVSEDIAERLENGFLPAARLFEIGRNEAVDLNPIRQNEIHPPARPGLKSFFWVLSCTFLVIAFCIFLIIVFGKVALGKAIARNFATFCFPWRKAKGKGKPRDSSGDSSLMKDQTDTDYISRLAWIFVYLFVLTFIFTGLAYWSHYRDEGGEPFSLLGGFSAWPTEALRLLSALLSILFILKARHDLEINEISIEERFSLKPPQEHRIPFWGQVYFCLKYLNMSSWIIRPRQNQKIKARTLWRNYLRRGRCAESSTRTIIISGIYVIVVRLLVSQMPQNPCRGGWVILLDRLIVCISGLLLIFLIFFVVDVTRLCIRFIRMIKEGTDWPDDLKKKAPPDAKNVTEWGAAQNMDNAEMDEWLDIRIIASRTQAVGKLIYYPFIVMFILFVARSRLFDNWHWPFMYIVAFSINLLIAVLCAVRMRYYAERSRKIAIRRLEHLYLGNLETPRGRQIQKMIEDIQLIREGAFSPFSENPVIGAILIPSGGITLLALLETFGKF